MNSIMIVKANLIGQMRSYKFIWMLASVLVIGMLCVPPSDAHYSVIGIGGMRGFYNSAWLGSVAAIISSIAIWIPGFYWLRSEITRDRKMRIFEMLESSPMTKRKYIICKMLSNMVVLLVLQLLFILSFIFLQFLRGESSVFQILDYMIPFCIISIPNLILLSSLTVFFDVIGFLKGILGNIVFLALWTFVTIFGSEINQLDFFYNGQITSQMYDTARQMYPDIISEQINFGYNPTDEIIPTFEWNGISWSHIPLEPVIFVLILSIVFIGLSILYEYVFKSQNKNKKFFSQRLFYKPKAIEHQLVTHFDGSLSPVQTGRHRFSILIYNEMRVMLFRLPIWQYALMAGAAIALPFLDQKLTPIIMFIPIMYLSKIGCYNQLQRTIEMIQGSCSPMKHLFSSYFAGIIISVVLSSVQLVHLSISGNITGVLSWLIGIVFACSLATFCGCFTGDRKLFEAIYLFIYYIWLNKLNDMTPFHFLGTMGNDYSIWYLLISLLLLLACIVKHKRHI